MSNVIYDPRFDFTAPVTPAGRIKGAVSTFGKLRPQPKAEITDDEGYLFGKRRLATMAAAVALAAGIGGSVHMVNESNKVVDRYQQKIEACAGILVGHEVHLAIDPGTELLIIPEDVFKQVQACKGTQGDVGRAEAKLQ